MPSPEQSLTFLPPLPPVSPCIPSSTHPRKSFAFLVGSQQRKKTDAAAAKTNAVGRPPIGPQDSGHGGHAFRKKVVYVEPLQNATSRRILSMYYQQQANVPVDWRNGLDMRSLAPAQDPNYLNPKQTNTYETNLKSAKPFYEGGLLNQLRHGHGKCQYRNAGFGYEGDWTHGRTNGQGKLQLPDGMYEGEFRNGEITGSGVRCWNDGSQYTGEFLDGEMHGQGLHLRANGERYEGGFVRNQRSGHGVLVMQDGTCYDGIFEEHRLNGPGTCEASSGDRYEGDWCRGNMDGVGEYWYANGDHYVGRFARNLREGKGFMFLAASSITLDCDWERDVPLLNPSRLTVESPDKLFWVAPTPPPPKKPAAEEGEGDAAAEEEEPVQLPQPPRSLKDILSEAHAPGASLPAIIVTVEGVEGGGTSTLQLRAKTPGGGLGGTQPQLGESGRLLFLSFGVFEREAPVESENPPVYILYVCICMCIYIYICVCGCLCMYMCVYIYIYVCVDLFDLCRLACLRKRRQFRLGIPRYINVYVHVYMFMWVCFLFLSSGMFEKEAPVKLENPLVYTCIYTCIYTCGCVFNFCCLAFCFLNSYPLPFLNFLFNPPPFCFLNYYPPPFLPSFPTTLYATHSITREHVG